MKNQHPRFKEYKFLTSLMLVLVSLTLFVSSCFAQDSTLQTQQLKVDEVNLKSDSSQKIVAFDFSESGLKDKHMARKAFREWANKPKPFGATALLCIFISLLGLGFFPKIIETSMFAVKESFWRCLGRAILTNICLLILFRVFIASKATIPLSILLIGLYELLLVAGLAVSIYLLGSQMTKKLGIQKLKFLESKPKISYLISILFGSLFIASLVQIPELGKLPPIGIRLAVLIATLGEGGLLMVLFKRSKQSA